MHINELNCVHARASQYKLAKRRHTDTYPDIRTYLHHCHGSRNVGLEELLQGAYVGGMDGFHVSVG